MTMSEGHPADAYPPHPYTYADYYRYHAEVQQHHYQPPPQREEEFQQEKTEDNDEDKSDEEEDKEEEEKKSEHATKKEEQSPDNRRRISGSGSDKENHENEARRLADSIVVEEAVETDPVIIAQNELIVKSTPKTDLEVALFGALERKKAHADRLTKEILKLKQFISKRKQTYKRKRKDDGAPTRALSAYNIFIQERFAQLAKENEKALKSDDTDAELKRVPPSSLVASTGSKWNDLSAEEKAKYEEKAKADRQRYEEQMAQYQPPDKNSNRKRNKTGYNMFFSAHVLRLKQTESGVPSERGSVARLVGTAWKQLSAEEKAYYEREADKHNGMNPVKDGEEDEDDEEVKRQMEYHHMHSHPEMHMHAPPIHPHDPRAHHAYYPPHMYGPPPPYGYDYSQHHQRHARSQGYQQQYPPPQRHPYDG